MKMEKTKVPETNMTLSKVTSSFIDCENSIGSDKDVWAMIVWIGNMILACFVAAEMIYLILRSCKNKTFMSDSEFCQRHLFNRRKTPRIVEEYRMSERRRVIEDTQTLEPLIPPSPGENEDCKNLDDVYVNLIIHTGRSKPIFDMERMDKLMIMEEYIKCPEQSLRISKPEELLQPNEDSRDPRKILILGCPGIGKTLLCRKLLRELSKVKGTVPEEANERFHYLFFFHFRNFNSEEKKSMSLQTLLSLGEYSEGKKLDGEMFRSVLENPSKILLVFDGLDEFKDHEKCIDDEKKHSGNGITKDMSFAALYVKVVKGKILKGATVLTTTRPYAVDSVQGLKFDRTVEILGFSTQKVKEYCTKFFHDEPSTMERIWQHVQSNLNLLYLCCIPVNCFIVCSLLEEMVKLAACSLEGVTLPTRLTEIYKGALKLFIFKHHTEYQGKTLKRSELLSDETFPSSVEEMLSGLKILALRGIKEKRLVFELEEVQGMENCGLLNRLPDVKNGPFTYKPQFCFIHLTMQEFVAARGIAKMKPQYLQKFVSSKIRDEKWYLVIQFVAGLLRDKETIVNGLFHDDYGIWSQTRASILLLMKCLYLYEGNRISFVKSAAAKFKSNRSFTNCVDLSNINLTPVDCTAVAYFLKHIDNLGYLNVYGNPSMGDGGCSELSKLIKSGGPQGLYVGGCGIGDQGLITVLEAMKTAETCNLSELYVYGNEITVEGYSYLCDTLMDEKCKLTGLAIDFVENLKLSNALKHRNCKLNMLQIHSHGNMKRSYSDITSALMDENCKVTDLRFDDSFALARVGMSHVCEALQNENCKLTKLVLLKRNVEDEELFLFCEALKDEHWKLTDLWLVNPGFMLNAINLHSLEVPENTIGVIITGTGYSFFKISDLGTSHLCAALKHKDCKLKKLRVQGSFLTKKGFDDLQNAIMHDNCKLEYLTLCNSLIVPETKFVNFVCSTMTVNGKKVLAKRGTLVIMRK